PHTGTSTSPNRRSASYPPSGATTSVGATHKTSFVSLPSLPHDRRRPRSAPTPTGRAGRGSSTDDRDRRPPHRPLLRLRQLLRPGRSLPPPWGAHLRRHDRNPYRDRRKRDHPRSAPEHRSVPVAQVGVRDRNRPLARRRPPPSPTIRRARGRRARGRHARPAGLDRGRPLVSTTIRLRGGMRLA